MATGKTRTSFKPGETGNRSGENTPRVEVYRKGQLIAKSEYYIRFVDDHREKMMALAMECIPRLRELAFQTKSSLAALGAIHEIHNRALGQAPLNVDVGGRVEHDHRHTFVHLLREVANEMKQVAAEITVEPPQEAAD